MFSKQKCLNNMIVKQNHFDFIHGAHNNAPKLLSVFIAHPVFVSNCDKLKYVKIFFHDHQNKHKYVAYIFQKEIILLTDGTSIQHIASMMTSPTNNKQLTTLRTLSVRLLMPISSTQSSCLRAPVFQTV